MRLLLRVVAFEDAAGAFDPRAAHVAAHVAGGHAALRVAPHALHLVGVAGGEHHQLAVERRGTPQAKVVTLFPLWMIGWLFAIGYLHPSFWRAVLMLLIWPFYLGRALAG